MLKLYKYDSEINVAVKAVQLEEEFQNLHWIFFSGKGKGNGEK